MPNALTLAGIATLGFVPGSAQVLLSPSGDIGSPEPDTATISALLLDGDIETGDRYGNRTMTLPFLVLGTDRASLSATIDAFLLATSAKSWQMVWTPAGCPSTTWNCFRATPTVMFAPRASESNVAQVSLTFQAKPFGLSASPQVTTVAATGGPTPFQIDGINSGTVLFGTRDTLFKYEGASSNKANSSGNCGRTLGSPVDISGEGSVSLRARSLITRSTVVQLNLFDNLGHFHSVTQTKILTNTWTLVQFAVSDFIGIDLTQISEWTVAFGVADANWWVDDVRAWPAASVGNSTAEGSVLNVPSILGSARTPVALAVGPATGTMDDLLLHSPPATQDPDLTILAGLAAGSVTIPTDDMNYDGNYSVVVALSASAGGSTSRVVTATVTQKLSGVTIATATVATTLVGTKSMVSLGQLVLPLVGFPAENNTGELDIVITSASGSDVFSDVALCDTEGQTMLIGGFDDNPTIVYVDAPDPTVGVGEVYATTGTDRTTAISIAAAAAPIGGPIQFEPGSNKLLAACSSGAPDVTVTYYPAWLHEALV